MAWEPEPCNKVASGTREVVRQYHKGGGACSECGQLRESRGAWFNISMCSWEVIYAYFSFIGPCNPFTVSETVRFGICDPAYLQCLRLLPGATVSASRPLCCPFLCLECPACLPGEQLPHLSHPSHPSLTPSLPPSFVVLAPGPGAAVFSVTCLHVTLLPTLSPLRPGPACPILVTTAEPGIALSSIGVGGWGSQARWASDGQALLQFHPMIFRVKPGEQFRRHSSAWSPALGIQ